MERMELTERLRQTTLCHRLNDRELAAIAEITSVRTLEKGEMLFFQGDEATGFFLLLSGQVRIFKASPDGREYTLHVVRPGHMFAEAAVFHGHDFPANCMAMERSTVAFLPREGFTRLIAGSPEICMKMMAALSAFLRELTAQLEELSLKEVPARLAAYLLQEAGPGDGSEVVLPFSKTELAHKIGTISATLSRNLRKFKELGLIEVKGRTIRLKDRRRLAAIAAGEKT